MSNETQPEIRFPGFTEDWKQRKLIEGVSKIGDGLHGTPSYSEDGDVFFINGNNLVNGKISITKETKFVNESDQSKDDKSLNVNTILMSINGTIGNLAWYNNEKVMLGKSIAYLTVSDFDKNFVYFYLQTPMMRKYFISNLTGTTIKNLGLKTIRNTELFVTDLDEQQKIGTFFKQLDDTIALHQRKLDLLKETKKGFLQKMFPKNGAKVPEIRFPGFTGDWEERKVGEIFKVTRGQVLAATETSESITEKNIYPVYSSQTKNDGLMGYYSDYLFDTAITWTTDGANAGTVNYRNGKFYSTNVNGVLLSDKGYANKAVAEIINRIAWKHVSKVGNPKLMNNVMSEITITIPSVEEQETISRFFTQLDSTITLHERELDLLKETKKGFLQKMFV
ncbi:restriction endonuclease subunit S [Enterococcus faecium]|uniref:restriction endonuclease subunit S n=1 Tax=Enterococcus faecium TaxID=1352 RepID=UPI001A064442|nr:restriction endonuclease subunit S [Enterococcus faecium]EGP5247218.1 restriction endonuclease subunit S [Enterococcus faecium]EGP5689007.1 restriction endonuclease subunit S [Enterococcus faecium]EGP5720941.1 restriction endonuclease subunit S [Enterococcus faecium]EME8067420.1 restriction endonuclease subunit S [Enterococcus faecium]EMF0267358.1 restriction endonuclease subunit S [Enterococcus faecium]